MTTYLSTQFIDAARRNPVTVTRGDRTFTVGAPAPGQRAELVVREGDELVGYITAYTDDEHGAVPARFANAGVAPRVVRTLEDALGEMLR